MIVTHRASFPTNLPDGFNTKTVMLFEEVENAINLVQANEFKTKISKEQTTFGRLQYCPKSLNKGVGQVLQTYGWTRLKHSFTYPFGNRGMGYREVDFHKKRIGVEVQFGKYAYLHWDVRKLEFMLVKSHIDMGLLICPDKDMQREMSSGVPCFEQVVYDLSELNYQGPLMVWGVTPSRV